MPRYVTRFYWKRKTMTKSPITGAERPKIAYGLYIKGIFIGALIDEK